MKKTIISLSKIDDRIKRVFFILFGKFGKNEFKLNEAIDFLEPYNVKGLSQILFELKEEQLIEVRKSPMDSRIRIYKITLDSFDTNIRVMDFLEIAGKVFDSDITLIFTFYKYLSSFSQETQQPSFYIGENSWHESFYTSENGEEIINSLININKINNNYFNNLNFFIEKIRLNYSNENLFKIRFLIYTLNSIVLSQQNDVPFQDIDIIESYVSLFIDKNIKLLRPTSILEIVSDQTPKVINITAKNEYFGKTDMTILDENEINLERYKIYTLLKDNKKIITINKNPLISNDCPNSDIVIYKPKFNQKIPKDKETEFKSTWKFLFDKNESHPPENNLDWGWVQISEYFSNDSSFTILDEGCLTRAGKEKEIRKKLVEKGIINSVTLIEKIKTDKNLDSSVVIIETKKNKKIKDEILFSEIILSDSSNKDEAPITVVATNKEVTENGFSLNPKDYIHESKYEPDEEGNNSPLELGRLSNYSHSIFDDIAKELKQFDIKIKFPLEKFTTDLNIYDHSSETINLEDIITDIVISTSKIKKNSDKEKNYSFKVGEIIIPLEYDNSRTFIVTEENIDEIDLNNFISLGIVERKYNKHLLVFLLNSAPINTKLKQLVSGNKINKKVLKTINLPVFSEDNVNKLVNILNLLFSISKGFHSSLNHLGNFIEDIVFSTLPFDKE
ncbi:MAG: N-6 DNA methylase [Cyanobacteriota bacterium]